MVTNGLANARSFAFRDSFLSFRAEFLNPSNVLI